MSDYILTDEMLSSAAKQVRTAMLDAMPKPSEYTYEFTEEFDEAMRPLLKRASRHKSIDKFARRAAAVFLAAFLGFTSWMAIDVEARAAVITWLRDVYENRIVYFFTGHREDALSERKVPTWLPEGYKETEAKSIPNFLDVRTYSNGENEISFQCYLDASNTQLEVLNKDIFPEVIYIDGIAADFYDASSIGETNELIWATESGNLFNISGFIEKETMVKIAESIK